MFDFVLTGPISGVSAGQYLGGVINELLAYAHIPFRANPGLLAASVAIVITLYFWWENIKGVPESSGKALLIMELTTVMVVMLIALVYLHAHRARRFPPAAVSKRSQRQAGPRFARLAGSLPMGSHDYARRDLRRPRPFRPGHERRRNSRPGLS